MRPTAETNERCVLEEAVRLHQAGRLDEALAVCGRAIMRDTASDVAHNFHGVLLCMAGRVADGEASFRNALQLNPSSAEALNNLGSARRDQGDLDSAERFYRRAVELQPTLGAGWRHLGLVQLARGRHEDAEACFRRAIEIDVWDAAAHNDLGTLLRIRGLLAEAEAEFRAAIDADPRLPEGWCGLGDVLPHGGMLDEAEACCRKALELRPSHADAMNNLATIARLRGRDDLAKAYCEDVLRSAPGHVGALNNLGMVAAGRGDYRTAEAEYRSALRADPNHAVTRFNLGTLLLLLGNYTEGFEFYESRFQAIPRPLTRSPRLDELIRTRPRWRGEALRGRRLLIWSEQGLGDCIMMLRYLTALEAHDVEAATLLCDASLARLVRAMRVPLDVVTLDRADETLRFDAHCPMMSLPGVFGGSLESVSGAVPYLTVPSWLVDRWCTRLPGSKLKVGLAWAGSRTLRDDSRRSIPLATFSPLFSIDGIEWVSLQKGDGADEWRSLGRDSAQWIDVCEDFLDTAALMTNLDLVISVDTAVAHLAGGLGRPVWLLNRYGSEWRWGLQSDTTPWYPSMKIFREPARHAWTRTIAEMARHLERLVADRPGAAGDS